MKFNVVGLADVGVCYARRPPLVHHPFAMSDVEGQITEHRKGIMKANNRIRAWSSHALDASIFVKDSASSLGKQSRKLAGRCVAM
jgi:hypothetical protein